MNYIIFAISFIIINLFIAYILKRVVKYHRIRRNFFDISLSLVLVIMLIICSLEILYYSFFPIDFAFSVIILSFIFALYLTKSVFRVKVKKAFSLLFVSVIFSIIPLYLVTIFLMDIYRVPNNSMAPYLEPNKTYVLVNKVSYGLNKPLYNEIIISWNKPQQGDIVLFKSPLDDKQNFISKNTLFSILNFLSFNLFGLPSNPSNPSNPNIIFARILSKPGEYLPYKNPYSNLEEYNKQHFLYIPKRNDKIEVILSPDRKTVRFSNTTRFSFTISIDSLPTNLRSYENSAKNLLYFYRFLFPDNLKSIILSKGEYVFQVYNDYYFVSADNKNSIYDSRYFGIIPYKNIIGKAFFIVIPIYNFSPILPKESDK